MVIIFILDWPYYFLHRKLFLHL